jgi:hypothetical protein
MDILENRPEALLFTSCWCRDGGWGKPPRERHNVTGCDAADVLSRITPREFMHDYVVPQRPLLLRNQLNQSKCRLYDNSKHMNSTS